jgi:hypothetical protein
MKKTVLILAVFLAMAFSGAYADTGKATIMDFEGTALVKKAGAKEFIDADVDMELTTGDQLVTKEKSRVDLVFDDDNSILRVEENTDMTVIKLEKTKTTRNSLISVILGKVITKINKVEGVENNFQVRTPSAIAAVKGTEFAVEAINKQSYVGVFDGTVSVAGFDLNNEKLHDVPVKKDKGITVAYNSRSYVPLPMRHDWKDGRLGLERIRAGLKVYQDLKKAGMWEKVKDARMAARLKAMADWKKENPGWYDKMTPDKKAKFNEFLEKNKALREKNFDDLRKKYPLLIDKFREIQRQRLVDIKRDHGDRPEPPERPDIEKQRPPRPKK